MLCLGQLYTQAANTDTGSIVNSETKIREKILEDIRLNLEQKNKSFDSTVSKLDLKIGLLDSAIKFTVSPKEKMDKLVERVQMLEEKQKALEENELITYEANYQSAVINLVSMDREIKPLILFHTTKDFFDALSETSNPMNYDGYRTAYDKFKLYVDKHKGNDVTLKAISDMFDISGGMAMRLPITGAFVQLTFSGMAKYINSIGHRKREMRKEAEKMFDITTKLSMFAGERDMIEAEWDGITESLNSMQSNYDSVLECNLAMLGTNKTDFYKRFTKESDANERYAYLTELRQRAADYVLRIRKADPKDWRENIYYQLTDVQTLKIKYGDITYNIRRHIDKYDELINKYKTDNVIGSHVVKLDQKLNRLKETFDSTFEPKEYVHAATRMYKVM